MTSTTTPSPRKSLTGAFPAAARIEILELTPPGQTLDEGGPIIPNEVRINGIPLLTSDEPGDEVTVHEIRTSGGGLSAALVTLTLLASSITVEARNPADDAAAREATQQARATEVDIARWTNQLDALGANTPEWRNALLSFVASGATAEKVAGLAADITSGRAIAARWTNELDILGANTPEWRNALLELVAAEPDPEMVRAYAESCARIADMAAAPTTWRDVWEDLGMAWRDLVRVVFRR